MDEISLKNLAEEAHEILIKWFGEEDEPPAFFKMGEEIMVCENTSQKSVVIMRDLLEARSDESYTYSFEGRLKSSKTGAVEYEDMAITIAVGRDRDEMYRIWQPFERVDGRIILKKPTLHEYASRSEIGW